MNVVSTSDIQRINSLLSKPLAPPGDEKRKQLKRMSDDRVSRWTDTLEAKRRARLEWKKRHDDEEEERRMQIDREEARVKRQMRLDLIERAKRLLYEKDARVKGVRSKQLYTDVIATREEQISELKARKTLLEEDEKKWHQQTIKQARDAEEIEKKKESLRKAREMHCAKEIDLQRIAQKRKEKAMAEQQRREEELSIKNMTMDDLASAQRDFLAKLERRKKSKADMEKTRLDAKEAYEAQARRELEEARKREEEIHSMHQRATARKMLEEKHFRARKTMLTHKAAQDIEARQAKEVEQFLRDVKIGEDRINAQNEKALQAKKDMADAIDKSRREQMLLQQKLKVEERRQESNFVEHMNKAMHELETKERRDASERESKARETRREQEEQWKESQRQREHDKVEKLLWGEKVAKESSIEDAKFKEFARKELEKFGALGKSTSLLKELLHSTHNN